MANEEHIRILMQSVKTWNKWREEYAEIRPDLSDANFSNASLSGCHFADFDLSKVKGIESIVHGGPYYIDIHTIYQTRSKIPEAFLVERLWW